jgi:hypothetical protein
MKTDRPFVVGVQQFIVVSAYYELLNYELAKL